MMGWVGTVHIEALYSIVEPLMNSSKIGNASAGNEANHQNGESKTPKKITRSWINLFTTKKLLGLQESHD